MQHGSAIKTHHLEYTDGGILDMDDLLTDLVDDKDKVSQGKALSCSRVSKEKPFSRSSLLHFDVLAC